MSQTLPLRVAALVTVALAYGAGSVLVVLHHLEGGHERGEPALLLHVLRDATLAVPGVLAAAWLGGTLAIRAVDRDGTLPAALRLAVLAAGTSLGASLVLAAGSPLHAALFAASEPSSLHAGVHLGRDAVMALAVALPLSVGVLGMAERRRTAAPATAQASVPAAAPDADAPAPIALPPLTRRGFVTAGAGTLALGGLLGTVARPGSVASAQSTDPFLRLYITEGNVPMVDGQLVYMRGYGASPTTLTIEPVVFHADGSPPVVSRVYPVGAPTGEKGHPGVDGSAGAPGLHVIKRNTWGSFFPRRTIIAEQGSTIRLRISNRLREPHTFTVQGTGVSATIPAGATDVPLEFPAPAPGTYLYHDTVNEPVNRVLGLHGALVVVATANKWTLNGSEGGFERQYLWILGNVDPEWSRQTRLGTTVNPARTPALPKYFMINDRSGVGAVAHSLNVAENKRAYEDGIPGGHGRATDVRNFASGPTGQLLRMVNAGVAHHQPHFHGNHVWTIAINNELLSRTTPTMTADGHIRFQHWEDVVEMDPKVTKAVMLPVKPPPDVVPEVLAAQDRDWHYPMHCHAEMSQTAGGGLYPGGLLSDWVFKP